MASRGADDLADAIAEKVVARLGELMPVGGGTKRLLSLKEAGQYMGGKSDHAIRHMVNTGIIPACVVKRLGTRRIFLDRIELDKWLTAQ